MPDDSFIIERMDQAAEALLSKITSGSMVEGQDTPSLDVKAQIDLFKVVVEWVKVRNQVAPPAPPAKEPSKFGQLKREFNGNSASGRGRPRKVASPPSPDNQGDGVVNGAASASVDHADIAAE